MCQINSYLLISESPSTIETCDSVVACSFNSWDFPRKKSSFTVILSTIMPVSARSLSKTPFWNGNLLISCWVRAVQQSWGLYYHALCGFFWFVLFSLFFSFWCFFGCCFLSTIENCKEIFPWALMFKKTWVKMSSCVDIIIFMVQIKQKQILHIVIFD